ncbi:MAG: phosphomannomutase/phosphoglucomutase [Nitrospirae bacterium]|nr:phosphomannomutase/phosphoglucomutase [Nitrospirota bacterium]
MTIPASIFRMYDIRGRVADELTPTTVERIGAAFAGMVRDRVAGGGFSRSGLPVVVVGRDMRLSSPELSQALIKGLTRSGIDVLTIGLCPTPLLYFTLHQPPTLKGPVGGGVMVTGSHNPPEYNGLKLCLGTDTLYGDALQQLAACVTTAGGPAPTPGTLEGQVKETAMRSAYLNHVALDLAGDRYGPAAGRGSGRLKIVVDAGNGTAGLVAPELLQRFGCEVIELYCEPDGRFPNHHPDPTIPANLAELIRTVKAERADFGVAYDGDADRIGVIDDQGSIIWGDQLLALFARSVLRQKPGSLVIADVKSSLIVERQVVGAGGRFLMWKTGHSLIKAKMKETKAALAGEMSGHLFFADRYFGFDDAIYATARLVEVVQRAKRQGLTLSKLIDWPATCATPEIRLDCPDDKKFALIERLDRQVKAAVEASSLRLKRVVAVDGIRAEFDGGWGLVRASNTQPVLVVRCEATTDDRLEAVKAVMRVMIEAAAKDAGVAVGGEW